MSIARKTLIGSLIIAVIAILTTAGTIAALSFRTADSVIQQQSEDRLVALREVQTEQLEIYLNRIKKQILTMSDSPMLKEAAQGFVSAFAEFDVAGPSTDTMRDALSSYYQDDYARKYRERNNGERIRTGRLLNTISDQAVRLQYHFIQENPNPLGSKDALVSLPQGGDYSALHEQYHPFIRRYLQEFAYYDIFIIDAETGQIVYSVFKELDFATSLLDGPYSNSGLAEVYKRVRNASDQNALSYSPFKSYTPSYEDPAAFLASPIQDANGNTIAVLAFQMPIDELNGIMTHGQQWQQKGLGLSGETYLVGENYKAQSISRFLIEDKANYIQALRDSQLDSESIDLIASKETNIGFQEIRTEGVSRALAGEKGFAIFPDYRNVPVLSAFGFVDFLGSRMAILVEIDEAEAFGFRATMLRDNGIATALVSLLVLALVWFVVWRYSSRLSLKLNQAVVVADHVSRGERVDLALPDNDELSNSGDEIDALMAALGRMQNELISDLSRRENEATRIKMALDVCDTSVMVIDAEQNIIYLNDSMQQCFTVAEEALRQVVPALDMNDLVGKSFDVFYGMPGLREQLNRQLMDSDLSQRIQFEAGERTLSLIATPIFDRDNQRLGTVVEWMDLTDQLARQNEERRVAEANARVKTALDTISASVMMADADNQIIYMNDAIKDTLRQSELELRQLVPSFEVAHLLDSDLDPITNTIGLNQQALAELNQEQTRTLKVEERHLDLTLNPVRDDQGQRIGTVIEWLDRSDEQAIQSEIDHIVSSANAGDLDARIHLEGKQGAFLNLSAGLNQLMDGMASFVSDLDEMFAAMSKGDLRQTIETQYQGRFEVIKANANQTVANLTSTLQQIQGASGVVRSSVNEVAQGSDDLSRRTETQASSLEQTASSMEQMTSQVKLTSENAGQANDLAERARVKAERGGDIVQDAVAAMSEILSSSKKINDIIGVIDEIAFQTNLLALNAAVEAARAGEQGRGFAVVAGEVRTLSQRSAAAAKEIKDLIRDSVSKVESGSVLVNQSGETLAEIVSAVEHVAAIIKEVNKASSEQTSGIYQINQAISQMDEMTQQNAALVEETSAASRSMSEEAARMSNLLGFFKLGGAVSSHEVATPAQTFQERPVPAAFAAPSVPAKGAQNTYSQGSTSQVSYKPQSPDDAVSSYLDDIW